MVGLRWGRFEGGSHAKESASLGSFQADKWVFSGNVLACEEGEMIIQTENTPIFRISSKNKTPHQRTCHAQHFCRCTKFQTKPPIICAREFPPPQF